SLDEPLGAVGESSAVYVRDPFGYRVELKARV
ncbi:lactoylglutathione lyase, partial [Halorubrum persicum]